MLPLLHRVLQGLLRERVPVRDVASIIETLADFAGKPERLETTSQVFVLPTTPGTYTLWADPSLFGGNDRPQLAFSLPGGTAKWLVVALHLSQFAGYAAPLAGFVVPIVIWQVAKDEHPEIDEHGRMVANWIISHLLYIVASVLLSFVGVGIPLLIVLAILGVIFPIIGAIRASQGVCWSYPLTIQFLSPSC